MTPHWQLFKNNFKEIVRVEKEQVDNINEYGQPFRMSKKAKAEYAQKMKDVETFVKENNIKQAQNGKSFYFELNGKKYRVSNHTVEASNAGAFNSEGQQVRELYHPDGREGEVQIFASPTRIIDIYNAIKEGKQVDGRGRIVGEEYNQEAKEYLQSLGIRNNPEELIQHKNELDNSKPISISKELLDISNEDELKEKAVKKFKELFKIGKVGEYYKVVNKGETIGIPMSLLKKLTTAKADIEFLRLIPNLEEIIKNGIYLYSSDVVKQNKNKLKDTKGYRYYAVKCDIGSPAYARFVVRELVNGDLVYSGDVVLERNIKEDTSLSGEPDLRAGTTKQWSSLLNHSLSRYFAIVKSLQNNNGYNQEDLGATSWDAAGRATITLMQNADASTLIHESGHVFLEVLQQNRTLNSLKHQIL